jgi:hypothetical protein
VAPWGLSRPIQNFLFALELYRKRSSHCQTTGARYKVLETPGIHHCTHLCEPTTDNCLVTFVPVRQNPDRNLSELVVFDLDYTLYVNESPTNNRWPLDRYPSDSTAQTFPQAQHRSRQVYLFIVNIRYNDTISFYPDIPSILSNLRGS